MGYSSYLWSDHWREFRGRALEHYGRQCSKCGSLKLLRVHHLTYERKGAEELDDVIILCKDCHHEEHNKKCEHTKLDKSTGYIGNEVSFWWQCHDCHHLISGREPSDKEIERANKWIARTEARMRIDALKAEQKAARKKARGDKSIFLGKSARAKKNKPKKQTG